MPTLFRLLGVCLVVLFAISCGRDEDGNSAKDSQSAESARRPNAPRSVVDVAPDSHHAVVEEMLGATREMVGTLASINDQTTGQKSVSRLRDITRKLEALARRQRALGDVPKHIRPLLEEILLQSTSEMEDSLQDAMIGLLEKPGLVHLVETPMEEFEQAAKRVGEMYLEE